LSGPVGSACAVRRPNGWRPIRTAWHRRRRMNYELSEQDLSRALQLVVDREQEIRDASHKHFDT
jgi:hypothetical protein